MVKKSSNNNNTGTMGKTKRGGTKRKIPIVQIENKKSRAVTLSKRTKGIFSKAAQLCRLSGCQIAILVASSSSNSNVSFNSFGHSSVDAVISAFLSGQPLAPVPSETTEEMEIEMEEDLGLGFWSEEEIPDTVEDLTNALKSVSELITHVDASLAERQRQHQHKNQELDQTPEMFVLDDDGLPCAFYHELDQTITLPCALNNNTQDDLAVCDSLDFETLEKMMSSDDDSTVALNNFDHIPSANLEGQEIGYDDFIAPALNGFEEHDQILPAVNLEDQDMDDDDDFSTFLENHLLSDDDDEDSAAAFNNYHITEEQDQIHVFCDSFANLQEMDLVL